MDDQRRQRLWRQVSASMLNGGLLWPDAVCRVVRDVASVEAAITVRTEGRAQDLLAASTRWAADLEEAQFTLGEGPGVEAFTERGPVLVDDLGEHLGRWPLFTDVARSAGVVGVFAFPLHVGGVFLGTMDLYRRHAGYLSPDALGGVATLADLATRMILRQVALDTASPDVEGVVEGGSYQDVHIATGMLAAQLHISLPDASARLRAHAFAVDRSLLAVCRDVLAWRISLDQWAD